MGHVDADDLERYYLGEVTDEEELASIEEHLLVCEQCVTVAEKTQDYVDLMRRAIIEGKWDP